MILFELFNQDVPFKVVNNTSARYDAVGEIDGRPYLIGLEHEAGRNWSCSFAAAAEQGQNGLKVSGTGSYRWTFQLTGSFNAAKVLALVIKVLDGFVKAKDVHKIFFTASGGREELYARIVKRYAKLYNYQFTVNKHEESTRFSITIDEKVNEALDHQGELDRAIKTIARPLLEATKTAIENLTLDIVDAGSKHLRKDPIRYLHTLRTSISDFEQLLKRRGVPLSQVLPEIQEQVAHELIRGLARGILNEIHPYAIKTFKLQAAIKRTLEEHKSKVLKLVAVPKPNLEEAFKLVKFVEKFTEWPELDEALAVVAERIEKERTSELVNHLKGAKGDLTSFLGELKDEELEAEMVEHGGLKPIYAKVLNDQKESIMKSLLTTYKLEVMESDSEEHMIVYSIRKVESVIEFLESYVSWPELKKLTEHLANEKKQVYAKHDIQA